ncbi:sensor histidine kinase [Motiliproteus sp. MSK22-1]|uniref:sensor histidine kinase n=1 Tax=Motiliproteus sp. MSK22-1 TaxID=1897630 RepID=UPI000975FC9A|nr:HAMP domain-containing sensor histidine kinase [Motiliproteus sp. MSK22-1]OMH33625.1 hypothetical protein BGP75_11430 [Motiliproteus sp. MSK22-1]
MTRPASVLPDFGSLNSPLSVSAADPVEEGGKVTDRIGIKDLMPMRGLQFLLTRSVRVFSAAILLVLLFSLGLLIYSAWHYVKRIEPLQQHLDYLMTIELTEVGVRKKVVSLLESESEYLNPEELSALLEQLQTLSKVETNRITGTPDVLSTALTHLREFDGAGRFRLNLALYALRDALNQELGAHKEMVSVLQVQAEREFRMALGIAFGILLFSALLWAMVRFRVLDPLNKLTEQMSQLARRDFSELSEEDADSVVLPIIKKYNYMTKRLMTLEKVQQQRHQLLTQEVRDATYMLLQQQRRLAQAERLGAVGEMAAGVAHELRNPLTSIQMALDNLRYDLVEEEIIERVDMIADETKRITRQLNQLLDQAKQRPEKAVMVDVGEEIETLVSLASYQLHQDTRLYFEVDEGLSCLLPGSRFRQVLLNLVLNAGQVIGEAVGEIRIGARQIGDKLEIRITDTGPGFPDAILESGVQPFQSSRAGGTGLGLVMVRRFAADLGGELSLSNSPEGGACVILSLPCNQNLDGGNG